MRLDDIGQQAAEDARRSTAGTTPPSLSSVVAVARWRRLMARGGVVAGAVAAVTLFVAISGTLGGGEELNPRISDPADTTSPTATTTTTTTSGTSLVTPVLPGLDAASVDSLRALPHPGVMLLTEDNLTPDLMAEIRDAIAGLDHDEEPLRIYAAFTKDGATHATVDYPSAETGLLVVENGTATRFRHGHDSWVDVHAIRKQGVGQSFPYTQITWVGVPDNTASARLSTVQRPDTIAEQRVIGNAVYFEVAKPDWTQYGTLTLLDSDGVEIATEEVRLDGSGCSAWLAGPVTAELPSTDLNAGRMELADAAYRCRTVAVAELALGEGPYFDLQAEDLAASLREADRREALFSSILFALKQPAAEAEGPDGTVYVFAWNNGPRKHRIELGFSEDGVWQYGILTDL